MKVLPLKQEEVYHTLMRLSSIIFEFLKFFYFYFFRFTECCFYAIIAVKEGDFMIKNEAEKTVRDRLFELADPTYRDFHAGLIPNVPRDKIIGVRTPVLRKYAAEIKGSELADGFIQNLPHGFYDENNLHAFLISYIKDEDVLKKELDRFLPYVDNWATCDMMRPKAIAKNPEGFLTYIRRLLCSDRTYEVRFGIEMLMAHFLDERYDEKYLSDVAALRSDEYYINMMISWYFATALAKQYDSAVTFFENRRLDAWTHNKAIQKACESFRVTAEHKAYLRTLKIK